MPPEGPWTGDELVTPSGEPLRYAISDYLGVGSATDFAVE